MHVKDVRRPPWDLKKIEGSTLHNQKLGIPRLFLVIDINPPAWCVTQVFASNATFSWRFGLSLTWQRESFESGDWNLLNCPRTQWHHGPLRPYALHFQSLATNSTGQITELCLCWWVSWVYEGFSIKMTICCTTVISQAVNLHVCTVWTGLHPCRRVWLYFGSRTSDAQVFASVYVPACLSGLCVLQFSVLCVNTRMQRKDRFRNLRLNVVSYKLEGLCSFCLSWVCNTNQTTLHHITLKGPRFIIKH